MAFLIGRDGALVPLHSEHVIGRSRRAQTRLDSSAISSLHVAIRWTGSEWTARDLGSRNGTTLDGAALEGGVAVRLTEGAVLALGRDGDTFTVGAVTPPAPLAVAGDRTAQGDGLLLGLPSLEEPVVLISRAEGAGWVAEGPAGVGSVEDGDEVEVLGVRWCLHLPDVARETLEQRGYASHIDDASLRFRVSRDEEHVELTVRLGDRLHALPPRAHHYVALTLARHRLAQARQGVDDAEAGWMDTAELGRMLRMSSNQLYVSFHRLRRELDGLGVVGADQIVARRAPARQVRLGVKEATIEPLT